MRTLAFPRLDTTRSIDRIDTLQQIELAEGVEVGLRVAGPFVRVYAYIIDWLIRALIYFILTIIVGFMGFSFSFIDGSEYAAGIFLLAMFLITWVYNIFFEAGKNGATPGKRMMGLRVVQPSGAPITFGQALVRNLLRFADMLPFITYGVGLCSIFFTKRFQRLGDLAANTLVIYNKPFQLQGMALSTETGIGTMAPIVMSREEESAIVSFAERAPFWSEDRRAELADYLSEMTNQSGVRGAEKLKSIGQWLQSER